MDRLAGTDILLNVLLGDIGHHIKLAGIKHIHHRFLVANDERVDHIDVDRVRIPIAVVLLKHQLALMVPLGQCKGAAANDRIRRGSVGLAILLRNVLADRIEAGRFENVHEIGHGAGCLDLKGIFVDRLDAIFIKRQLALADRSTIGDVIAHPLVVSVRRTVTGVNDTLEAVFKIRRRHLDAIGPVGFAQMESIGQTVSGNLPLFSQARGQHIVVNTNKTLIHHATRANAV